ncbi:MAG: tetratricopeptide repeat protein [Salinivirgaceae bacterium]|nr:tetratricopeptide repeat protein [Salinivirgaceae bacterium]
MKLVYIFIFSLLLYSCNKDIETSDSIDNSIVVIDSLMQISRANFNSTQNNPEVFDNYLIKAVEIADKQGNKKKLFDIYIFVAKRCRNISEYSKALEYLQLAQEIGNDLNSDELKAYATHEMAVNFRRIDDNAQALKFHIKALEWAENVHDTFLIHCSLNGIGNVYFSYKDYQQAIQYFHQSLQYLGKATPNLLGEAINTNTIGEAWSFLGNNDSALYYLERSLQVNFYINSKLGQAICFNGIGMINHEKKEYLNAIKSYQAALEIYETMGDLFYETMCLNNLGKTYHTLKDYKKASLTFKKSFDISRNIGCKEHALDAAIELSRLYYELNNSEKSFYYNQIGLAYKDSITMELRDQNSKAMNVLYEAEKQKREILILKQKAELNELKLSRQKFFFLSVLFILFASILFGIFIHRQRQLRNKLTEIGLEQKLLRTQLNPHFIFNSLSAIQNFIMKSDKISASEYLVNFSRLMRNILIGSGSDFILLENELEILEDYLKLQRLRYIGRFDYRFEVADNLHKETCLVPPMLVQPFIENAIEHGVRGIDNQGEIVIRFKKSNLHMIIEVEDNGKGINEQMAEENKNGHISMATKITRKRMQTLEQLTKIKCNLEIINKQDKSENSGVLVIITIPFNNED